MESRRRRRLIFGLVLILVGGWFYLAELGYLADLGEELVLLALGAIFLVAYFVADNYGFLVPGCILLGLGAGVAFDAQLEPLGEGPLLGLAVGFLAIYLVPLAQRRQVSWWPLVPALVLFFLAVPALRDLFDLVASHWQLILVLVGVVLVVLALGGGRGERERHTPGGGGRERHGGGREAGS